MYVQTQKTQDGLIWVRVTHGLTQYLSLFFKTRHDAAVFLQALRKRER